MNASRKIPGQRNSIDSVYGELSGIYLILESFIELMVINGFIDSQDMLEKIDGCVLRSEERSINSEFSCDAKMAMILSIERMNANLKDRLERFFRAAELDEKRD